MWENEAYKVGREACVRGKESLHGKSSIFRDWSPDSRVIYGIARVLIVNFIYISRSALEKIRKLIEVVYVYWLYWLQKRTVVY